MRHVEEAFLQAKEENLHSITLETRVIEMLHINSHQQKELAQLT